MKTFLQKLVSIAILVSIYFSSHQLHAQCGAGYTRAVINWDLHYFGSTPPASPLYFSFGKNEMRLGWSTATFRGVTGAHTGSGSSFGNGRDIKFDAVTGTDTLVFNDEVSNLKFSVYDIDNRHRVTVTATNAAGTSQNITVAKISGTNLTVSGSGTPTAIASTTSTTNIANTSTDGTANFTIAGPVKTVIIAISKTSGTSTDSLYISDISACNNNAVTGVFATNYHSISTPETGQPWYILASYGDSIVGVNMVTNQVELIYEVGNTNLIDTLFPPAINSLAFDPVNQVVYFCDNARATRNRAIYKYNVRTNVKSTWVADVNTLGIPTYSNGMGSGGAAFYDGALYIGQDMQFANEPASVYRIDVDPATGNPSPKAYRVWSKLGFTSSSLYDWADFVINDGIFYNFNSSPGRVANTGLEHIDMNLDSTIAGYSLTSTIVNGSQSGINYQGNIYHFNGTNYALYNKTTGTFGATTSYTGSGTIPLTDAAEAFKYPLDFSDAPSSYGKAYHLYSKTQNLKLGTTIDYESKDTINLSASADDNYNTGSVNDEDAISSFPALTVAHTSYTLTLTVTNTTGASATLYGYIDFNRDGDFADAGERSLPTTVPNAATSAVLTWTGLTGGSVGSSFIRFRLAANATEAQNFGGYAATGEVEDYQIPITASSLPVELISFKGELKDNNTTLLSWSTASELNNDYFDVQRKNQKTGNWESIGRVKGFGNSRQLISYNFTDNEPQDGENYYRLNQVDYDGRAEYSSTIMIKVGTTAPDKKGEFVLYPNPTKNEIWIKSEENITSANEVPVEIYNISGEIVYASVMKENLYRLDFSHYQSGMYIARIGSKTYRILKE